MTSIRPAPENRYQALFLIGKQSCPGRLDEIILDPLRDLLVSLGSGKMRHLGLICHSLPWGLQHEDECVCDFFFPPAEAHQQRSAQNWKPGGLLGLQQPASWTPGPERSRPCSRPGLGLGDVLCAPLSSMAGSFLWETEDLMQRND